VPADVVVRHVVLPDGELLMVADSRGAGRRPTELPEPRAALNATGPVRRSEPAPVITRAATPARRVG